MTGAFLRHKGKKNPKKRLDIFKFYAMIRKETNLTWERNIHTMDKHYTFQTQGVCASEISFDLIDGHVFNVNFKGGCRGNTQGVAILADGLEARAAIKRLKGVECHGGTSCPDQLAIAIAQCLESMGESV
jgi:uncharacterized protein (TIGR03905 family)